MVKRFGDRVAVDGVTFAVDPGEIYGLLGPNGAGKTTTIKLACGLLEADAGSATVMGTDARALSSKRQVGYVPQDIALYPDLTARENLAFIARLYGLRRRQLRERVDEALALTELSERGGDRVDSFSGGMKRRLNIAAGDQAAVDGLLRQVRALPSTTRIAVGSLIRRRRRTLSTVVVIAFAVGTLLAVLGLAAGVTATSRASWGDHGEDIKITAVGTRPFDAHAAAVIRATPGVAAIEPMFVTDVRFDGKAARIWAVEQVTMFHYRMAAGRWYTAAEAQSQTRVVVVERALARVTDTRVGQTLTVQTASGPLALRVIGIASNQQESGTAMFVPLSTMHAVTTGRPQDANDYWVRTTSHGHDFIDATTNRIQAALAGQGYLNGSEIKYVKLASEQAGFRTLTTTLAVVGFLVVAISMAGLASALAASVLEQTREIGILRSIGARGRHIRRIFATETTLLATSGWLVALPLGYLLDRFLVWMARVVVNVDVSFAFPPGYIPLALVGTVVLALLITAAPIRRAARMRPGEALRYA